MARYRVHGRDQHSGIAGSLVIEASDQRSALLEASKSAGFQVTGAESLDPAPAAAPGVTIEQIEELLDRRSLPRGTFGRTALACMTGSFCTSLLVGGAWGIVVGVSSNMVVVSVAGVAMLALGVVVLVLLVTGANQAARSR